MIEAADFYATSSAGALWHGRLAPEVVAPVIIEQRGSYDDDDYGPLLGVDEQAVYWLARPLGPESARSDEAPVLLFRSCRQRL